MAIRTFKPYCCMFLKPRTDLFLPVNAESWLHGALADLSSEHGRAGVFSWTRLVRTVEKKIIIRTSVYSCNQSVPNVFMKA